VQGIRIFPECCNLGKFLFVVWLGFRLVISARGLNICGPSLTEDV
jgi:hypothetical protein